MFRISIGCVSCPQAGRLITRYGYQLAILSPLGMKDMVSGPLENLTVTETLGMEGAWIRIKLGESQKILL